MSRHLKLLPGEVDQTATASLGRIAAAKRLRARNRGDLSSAVVSAGFYARKCNETMWGYLGTSYGTAVWRVSMKAGEYLDPISNSGQRVFSVDPDMTVTVYEVERG